VLERQPQLIDVRLQLGKILQSLGREAEAIEVYESARTLTRNVATEHHINGLIEAFRRRFQQAAKLFERAALLEPENIFHWLVLGLTHLESEAPIEALRAFDQVLERNPNDIVALSHSYDWSLD
jgi:tetratricopeptide (TPR) repeat protein